MIKDTKEKVQRDVDMMSTTVGGNTVQGSAGEFLEGESSDDCIDKLTQRSDSTRLSRARTCCTKSTGRKQGRLARVLEYNKNKAAAAGEKFEIVDPNERKEAQCAAMLHFTTSDEYFAVETSELDGLDSAQKIGEIITRADAGKYTLQSPRPIIW